MQRRPDKWRFEYHFDLSDVNAICKVRFNIRLFFLKSTHRQMEQF